MNDMDSQLGHSSDSAGDPVARVLAELPPQIGQMLGSTVVLSTRSHGNSYLVPPSQRRSGSQIQTRPNGPLLHYNWPKAGCVPW